MRFLNELRDKRRKFLDGLEANQEDIKLDIFKDFYPDKAHFIYELLQNAEDTGASEVRFLLSGQSLVFEHDGRTFDEDDIRTITGIGVGTKSDDDDKIGRFGIGFKAVFVYTETPRIWSPTFAFEISDFVMPTELAPNPSIGNCTRFEFPFNSPKKTASDAFSEIRAGLEETSEATLLFLSHIEAIHWRVEGGANASLLRVPHSEHHIETLKESEGKAIESSHFLRFTQTVEGLKRQYVAVAFDLQALPNVSNFGANKPLSDQFRIVPAVPGSVAVFFTATKETSGLRFHLHAPFVPELSRASIKDTPLNIPLFRQLAELSARSLFTIRDLGLLNAEILAALPNPHDDLPVRYECIREAIVDAMNEQPLTPTYARSYAPARQMLQAPAVLKVLLDEKDLEFLVDLEDSPSVWAIAAMQNSNVDRFLSGLAIKEWGIEEFVQILEHGLNVNRRFDYESRAWIDGADECLVNWMRSKPDEWHQRLYAFLYRALEPEHEVARLEESCIVRLSTGDHRKGEECYFPTEEVREDPMFPRVAVGTYKSGRGKKEQDRARKFLEGVGVREVGEREQIESILRQRYSEGSDIPSKKTHRNDLRRFIALMEDNSRLAGLFKEYVIFALEDGTWGKPGRVYLDAPYMDSGLRSYYRGLGARSKRIALAESYMKLGVSLNKLARFARLVGAASQLEIASVRCQENPNWSHLRRASGAYFTYSGIDQDFTIHGLADLLHTPKVELSRLVWNTLCNRCQNGQYLQACYRYNRSNPARYADSQLVHILRASAWIPQRDGEYVCPSVASKDLLPGGFPFDFGSQWIKAIGFGEDNARRVEERRKTQQIAKELGFGDDEALEDAKRFAELAPDIRRRILEEHEASTDLPNHRPSDPKRRTEAVRELARDAPERTTEERTRTVSVNREAVKREKTVPYLRGLYTNDDGVTICQVCKAALPFKLADGHYYVEAVEFLPTLERHHYQNYLALCPNHAAMYMHANDSTSTMKETFLALDGGELELILAGEVATLYFNESHIFDLQVVIDEERAEGA